MGSLAGNAALTTSRSGLRGQSHTTTTSSGAPMGRGLRPTSQAALIPTSLLTSTPTRGSIRVARRGMLRLIPSTLQPVQPQVSYVQAAPQVRTVYTADPMFFNFGRYFNNNLGGKADYGHDAGRRKYPTYGDYYRTHRYPLNDGWMLWDEDLRDLDSKSNKIGLGKDGGR